MCCHELEEAKNRIEELEDEVERLEKLEISNNYIFTNDDIKGISDSVYHCDLDLKKLIEEIGIDLVKKTLATF
jgi:predicted nuclease with TOPRIM domain